MESAQAAAARLYEEDDPMRWPFMVGMLEAQLKDYQHFLQNAQERIKELELELLYKDSK